MASVTEIKDRFVSILNSLGSIFVDTYKDTEAEAIDLNVQQMMDGATAKGGPIGQYSEFTKQIKKSKGQISEWVTLRDEGDFQSKMHFKTLNEQYAEINSSDWKTDKLTEKYGQDIFGLSPTNLKIYARENWFTSFVEKIKLKLYGRN